MLLVVGLGFVFIPACLAAQGAISLPATGQTVLYHSGDDGDLMKGVAWPVPRFVDNGDGTITDNLTKRIWLKNGNCPNATGNWQTALQDVAELNSSGTMNGNDCGDTSNGGSHQSDWRLPNVLELESLMNVGEDNTGSWLQGQGFENIPYNVGGFVERYWSSTTYQTDVGDNREHAWTVEITDERVRHEDKASTSRYIWAVRGNEPAPADLWRTGQTTQYAAGDDGAYQLGVPSPSPRFVDSGKGTVFDLLSGLVWLRTAECAQVQVHWVTALQYVGELNTSGTMNGNDCGDTSNSGTHQTDWRLPNRKELLSLIDYGDINPALPSGYPFTNVDPGHWYWSSSTFGTSNNAFTMSIGSGSRSDDDKDTEVDSVWAVRGPVNAARVIPAASTSGLAGLALLLAIVGAILVFRWRAG